MKVLVVDDDPALRQLMCELLRSDPNLETLEAGDGQEAWEMMASGVVPDLSIVDIRMPRMGGLELLAKFRTDHRLRQQKLMLCSTVNDRATIVRAAALGINAYLLKPFRAEKFLDQVHRLCESPAPTVAALEPLATVLGRLGSGKQIYLELLKVFTRDVTNLVDHLRAQTAEFDRSDLVLRLGAIEDAGRSLGAQGLVGAALKLARVLSADELLPILPAIEALQAENERVIAAAAEIPQDPEPPGIRPQPTRARMATHCA
jgi:two-component system, chemotaxis family, chemotaxis protein CheY